MDKLVERSEACGTCIINRTDPEGAYTAEDYARWMGNDTGELAAVIELFADYQDTGLSPADITALQARVAELERELQGAVRLPCRCKNCKFGTLDLAMSSPVNGWVYACEWNRNYWRSGDGFCSSGRPRTDAEKAREDGK